jgi:hypothetical protein
VPPITGIIQGSFHSTGGAAGLTNQDFLASGSLTQAPNTGASSAAVSGTLNFTEPGTNTSDYPCFATAYLYGQISGNSVNLQIVGSAQTILGAIGEPPVRMESQALIPSPLTPRSAATFFIPSAHLT